jgi:hypothetical protein
MSGQPDPIATLKADLESHKSADPNTVHGIMDRLRTLIPKYVSMTPTAIQGSMTMDGAWRDLDLSAYLPTTVFMVNIVISGVDEGRWSMCYFRPNGSSESGGETRFLWEVIDPVSGNCKFAKATAQLWCSMVDRTLEYNISSEGTLTILLIGYWKLGV